MKPEGNKLEGRNRPHRPGTPPQSNHANRLTQYSHRVDEKQTRLVRVYRKHCIRTKDKGSDRDHTEITYRHRNDREIRHAHQKGKDRHETQIRESSCHTLCQRVSSLGRHISRAFFLDQLHDYGDPLHLYRPLTLRSHLPIHDKASRLAEMFNTTHRQTGRDEHARQQTIINITDITTIKMGLENRNSKKNTNQHKFGLF